MLGSMYRAMSVHIKEPQTAEITGALHYGISRDHIVVLGR